MFLFYLLLGALVFSNIEDWSYLDAVYWADVTLFTVGFGDFTPQTALGKALMMPYALVGVISLGLVIASIRSLILERGKRRMEARVEEKQRRRIVRAMTLNGNDFILSPMKKNEPTSLNEASHAGTPLNELERRKAEFELMRKIQAQALSRRRWISMAISTGTWLVLWFVGAVVFRRFEKEYQKWNYFDGVYFCFVTLTTIGYGDVTPISNGGKSFFVFWSLLALPTMTVLISNAGDTVVKLIRDATITLGNITILPSDEGVKGNIMRIVHKLTRGSVFPDYRPPQEEQIEFGDVTDISDADEAPASNRSEKPAESDDNPTRGRTNFLDPEKAESSERPPLHSPTPTTFTSQIRRSLSRFRDPLNELPTGTDFHFLLISEIQAVTRHLRGSKPRRYNFEEWAWYLKLIGEDESNPENHLKPRPKPPRSARLRGQHGSKDFRRHEHCSQDNELRNTTEHSAVEGEVFKWSWVGHRSPLMGSQEESEWILDRLTHRLRESLSAERRRQLKQKPTNSSRPAFRKYGPKRVGTGYGSGMKQNKAPPR
jgi:potassium channel subfamily K